MQSHCKRLVLRVFYVSSFANPFLYFILLFSVFVWLHMCTLYAHCRCQYMYTSLMQYYYYIITHMKLWHLDHAPVHVTSDDCQVCK